MAAAAWVMADAGRFAAAEKAARAGRLLGRVSGRITTLPPPLSRWTASRDAPRPPAQTFREWWANEHKAPPSAPGSGDAGAEARGSHPDDAGEAAGHLPSDGEGAGPEPGWTR
jgi:L-lactate dehydrogenase complex protein LldF